MPALMTHSDALQAFLDAVRDDFESDAPRLALANWLDARDDPRGEMIRLSCGWAAEEHNSPQRDELDFRLGSWRRRWLAEWLGSLTQIQIQRGLLLLFVNASDCPFDYFRTRVGPELTGWVGGVQCWPTDDRTLAALTAWPWLPLLHLNGAHGITDAGTAHLARLTGLRGLSLFGDAPTGAAICALSLLGQLRLLNLFTHNDQLADGLPRLAELPALESLHLALPWPGLERFAPVACPAFAASALRAVRACQTRPSPSCLGWPGFRSCACTTATAWLAPGWSQ
jgi:uncharacterized protein (TIGR02996 family)